MLAFEECIHSHAKKHNPNSLRLVIISSLCYVHKCKGFSTTKLSRAYKEAYFVTMLVIHKIYGMHLCLVFANWC